MLIAKFQTEPLGSFCTQTTQSEAALLWGLDQCHLAIELPHFDIVTMSKSSGHNIASRVTGRWFAGSYRITGSGTSAEPKIRDLIF
jgi:hypothetical protein